MQWRRLGLYSAAHTLALWAMGFGFAVCALMLHSVLAAALVVVIVGVLRLSIITNAEARRIRADARAVSFRSRLRKVTGPKAAVPTPAAHEGQAPEVAAR